MALVGCGRNKVERTAFGNFRGGATAGYSLRYMGSYTGVMGWCRAENGHDSWAAVRRVPDFGSSIAEGSDLATRSHRIY